MKRRPLLWDLFCGAGGAAAGYAAAGFEVIGVDIEPQPNYPFTFFQADALAAPPDGLRLADAIHASPPCQFATALNNDKTRHLNLIGPTRELLLRAGRPYVIENVEGARPWLWGPKVLCGSMFDLGAQGHRLERHRLFETNWPFTPPLIHEHDTRPVVGVYGGHARNRAAGAGGRGTRDVWEGGHVVAMRQALDMHWGTAAELSEAIPPAYTEYIGQQLRRYLNAQL